MSDESIQKGLEQDARRISERIPMEITKANALQKAKVLKIFMEERGWTQAKVARRIGVSSTQISQFLGDKYEGNLKDLINKVVSLINSVTRQERRVRNKPYIETTIAVKIATLIKQTEAFSGAEGKIALIIGDSGHGKSHCLQQYAEANKNTIYIELDDVMYSTMIFSAIAKKLGIDSSGSLAAVTRRLIENLQNRQIIIMLDEASSLTVRQLNQLRQIIVTKSQCPLVLAGNRHLLKTVMQPTVKRGNESLDQFTSRLMCILDLDARASDKDGGLYTVSDIRKLFEYGGLRLTSDAVGTLRKISKTPKGGRLWTCSCIIEALHLSPDVEKIDKIDAALIVTAIKELDLPVKVYLPVVTIGEPAEEQEEKQAAVKAG